MAEKTPFLALAEKRLSRDIVAVDLGYSEKAKSCGVASARSLQAKQVHFGKAVSIVAEYLNGMDQPLLVLEAALSTCHLENGNPTIRGDFEAGRGWYWGPGAVSALAARRFLEQLAPQLTKSVFLAEAFLSNKDQRTRHCDDATSIVRSFWECKPVPLRAGTEPLLPIIKGVPSIRVFKPLTRP